MIRYFLFILCSTIYVNVSGQDVPKHAITGIVYDSLFTPSNSSNVTLYNLRDSSINKVVLSNKKGEYTFTNLNTGKYFISITRTGYKTYYTGPININDSGSMIVKIADIKLEKEVKQLSTVSIVVKKPLIEQTDDKITYNTESDPLAATESALDLLRKTPLVTVDGSGNITVNGQSTFKVLLNGRETSMFARNVSEALKAFPGKLITKIEIITSPSAKYDGEGVGGLINIITKKKVAGYNGTLNVTGSNTGFLYENLSLNIKYGKWGISSYLGNGGNYNQRRFTSQTTESIHPVAFYKRTSDGQTNVTNSWIYGNVEVNYELDSLRTVSGYFAPSGGGNTNNGTSNFEMILPDIIDTVNSNYISYNKNTYPSYNAGLDYVKKFNNNPDKEFSIKVNGDFGHDDTYSTSDQYNPYSKRFIINNNTAINNQFTVQSDYILPLQKSRKIEFGAKIITRNATSDYLSKIKYQNDIDYKINYPNSDHFDYRQYVLSLYSTYTFVIKKYSFRTGIRAEQTDLNGTFKNAAKEVKQHYINFLPNILVSTKLKKGQTLSLSYNMRLSRPYIWNLNPFINNIDSLNVSTGNPDLTAQTFHTLQLQYRFSAGKSFINMGLTGNFSNNQIIQYLNFDNTTGITTTIPKNIGRSFQTAYNISFNGNISDAWSVNVNGRIAYDIIQNNTSAQSHLSNSGFSGNGFLNTSYKLNKHFAASAYFGFYRSSVTLQGGGTFNIYYRTGFNYKFLNDKFTLSVSAANLHEKYFTYRSIYNDPNFRSASAVAYPYRAIQASITYNFGKLSENVSKKRGVSNDDLLAK